MTALSALLYVAICGCTNSIPLGLDIYMPVPEQNPITRDKVMVGRRLFFDRRLSRDEDVRILVES